MCSSLYIQPVVLSWLSILIFISQGSIYDTANVSCLKRTAILVVSKCLEIHFLLLRFECVCRKIFCVALNLLDVFSHCKSSPDFLLARAGCRAAVQVLKRCTRLVFELCHWRQQSCKADRRPFPKVISGQKLSMVHCGGCQTGARWVADVKEREQEYERTQMREGVCGKCCLPVMHQQM